MMLKPRRSRSNNEGMGSPTAASRLVEVVPNACGGKVDAAVQEAAKTRVLRGRFLKGFTSRELRERLSQQRVGRKKCPMFHQPVTKAAVITSCGDWEFPPARPTAPGRKVYRRGSVRGVRSLCDNPVGIAKAREEYEDDKFAKSAVETVRSRLAWWRKRAREHKVSPYPVTVEHLKLMGSLLKKAGYRSAGAYLSAVKNQHIWLGNNWSDALDLELREGKRACERGIGPPRKCGALDMQKLADLAVGRDPLCAGGPIFPREGTLCGAWWAMREVELSTARCMQVTFLGGEGCGRCVFDLPVTKTDPQALGKKRTHACACSATVAGGGLCVQSRWPGSCTMVHSIIVRMVHTQFRR